MIDTFAVNLPYPRKPQLDDLQSKHGWRVLSESLSRYQFKLINNGDEPNCPQLTIFQTPKNEYWIYVKVSMPKLLFGTNTRLATENEFKQGLQHLQEYIGEKAQFNFDINSATVSRVDYTRNLQVGEHVTPYILAASRFSLQGFNRHVINDETVYFQRKKLSAKNLQPASVIKFYDKEKEVLSRENSTDEEAEEAKGILRVEYAFHNGRSVQRLTNKLKLPDRRAQTLLSRQVADEVMRTKEIKYLLNRCEKFELSTMQILLAKFSARKATQLKGFLDLVKLYGENFHKKPKLDVSRSWYYQRARECRIAGAWVEDV